MPAGQPARRPRRRAARTVDARGATSPGSPPRARGCLQPRSTMPASCWPGRCEPRLVEQEEAIRRLRAAGSPPPAAVDLFGVVVAARATRLPRAGRFPPLQVGPLQRILDVV